MCIRDSYRIEEVTAPDGYTISKNYVTVAVDTDTAYLTDPVTGDAVIDVEYTLSLIHIFLLLPRIE